MTFPEIESKAASAASQTRFKRQLAEQAIAQAAAADWAEAAESNRRLLALGADAEAENRLAKALWELGELGSAREHYQSALALDPDQPDRGAQHRPPADVARGDRREDGAGPGGLQGAGLDLRRGDRQDRVRVPDRPRATRASSRR